MASVHDVTAYIIERHGEITSLKLHKLLYYSQAWFLVCTGLPLFPEPTQAWRSGPVQPDVYKHHVGKKVLKSWKHGSSAKLTYQHKIGIDAILSIYGPMSPEALRDLTHDEAPWSDAREDLSPTDRSKREIEHQSMAAFYSTQESIGRRLKMHWIDRQIRDLYVTINTLAKKTDKDSAAKADQFRSLLRTLQQKHAVLLAENFDAQRLTRPKSGPSSLEKAKTLLERHGVTASRNASTSTSHRKKAQA